MSEHADELIEPVVTGGDDGYIDPPGSGWVPVVIN
jgi:hypothetical protein